MLKPLSIAAALLLAQGAAAQPFYGLATLGFSDFRGGEADYICRGQLDCDRTGTAVKLIGGYKFAPSLSAELGFWDYGRITGRSGSFQQDLAAKAFGGGVAYQAQFQPKWLGTARIGLASMDARKTNNLGLSIRETSVQLYGGLALGYSLAPNLALDGGWDFAFASLNGSDFEINALSIGLRLGF